MRDTEYSDEDLMKSHYYDEEEHRNSLSGQIWRNDHERQIVLDLEAMVKTDEFWGRALASAVLRIWRDLSVERNENAAKISALNSTLESALIAFERIAIGNAFCNPRETAMLMYNEIKQRLSCEETPEMKGPDLTGIERECCGTFHGTPHRSTCKNFNTKTRKRDPFYEDGGSGHDLAI